MLRWMIGCENFESGQFIDHDDHFLENIYEVKLDMYVWALVNLESYENIIFIDPKQTSILKTRHTD